jgi:hypothetical protein
MIIFNEFINFFFVNILIHLLIYYYILNYL